MQLTELAQPVLPVVLALALTFIVSTVAFLFNKAHHNMVRDDERVVREIREMQAEVEALAAAGAAGSSRPCAVCGKDAPLRCKGCSVRIYCGQPCQRKDWQAGHKKECKKLREKERCKSRSLGGLAKDATGKATTSGSSAAATTAGATSVGSSTGGGSGSGEAPVNTAEANTLPPVPSKVIFPYDSFLRLLAAAPSRSRPVGLANAGNTCFANSLLQPLMATQPLATYLLSGEHSAGCNKRSSGLAALTGRGDFCLLCDLEDLLRDAFKAGSNSSSGSSYAVINPRAMLKNIKRIGKQFTFGHQEDSHELYVQMLDCMERTMLEQAGGKTKFDLRSRETTLMHHIFGGYLRHQVACLSCGHVSKTYDCCLTLPLEVPHRAHSLEAALQHFTARERLDGENKYKCDRCKALVAADRSTEIEVAPNVLQICLKRFGMGRFGKLRNSLSYPDQLDLSPYMADDCLDEQPVRYNLYGVVIHQGYYASSGHYVSYVKVGDAWFSCNDDSVVKVAAHAVLKDNAYLLFYQRETPRIIPVGLRSSPPTPRVRPAASSGAARALEEEEPASSAVLGRIQTAPAALSHMQDAAVAAAAAVAAVDASSAAASTQYATKGASLSTAASLASSVDQLELPGQPPAAFPERFHPSVSESNLAERAAPSSELGNVGSTGGGGREQHSGLASEAAAGAERKAAAVGAAGEGSSGAASEDGEEGDLAPAANPFELLADAGNEGQEQEEQQLEGSSALEQQPAARGEATALQHAEQVKAGSCTAQEEASCLSQQGMYSAVGGGGSNSSSSSTTVGGLANGHLVGDAVSGGGTNESARGGSSGDGGCVPFYRLQQKQLDDGTEVIRLSVDLPGVCGEDIELRVHSNQRSLWLGAEQYSTTLDLPAPVEPIQRSVKWVAKSERLVAMFNVLNS